MAGRPLLCRLNMHHVWHTESTEDGGRYRKCVKCGKEDSGVPRGPAPGIGA